MQYYPITDTFHKNTEYNSTDACVIQWTKDLSDFGHSVRFWTALSTSNYIFQAFAKEIGEST